MSDIHFGTDGWRAIIGEDFTEENVRRVIGAAAHVFAQDVAGAVHDTPQGMATLGTLYVGHDCRQDAHAYAQIAAEVAAAHGFRVKLTQDYCPTPALCWSVAHDPEAVGGIMLTSSHNPAEYLGVKLRMADGGASPKEFTDRVEAAMDADEVSPLDDADAPTRTICEAVHGHGSAACAGAGTVEEVDLMAPYLAALRTLVDVDAIRAAGLRVVVDPLYGAGRHYLADLLRDMGVDVVEINNACDPTFDGLHPEPIPPWVDRGLAKVRELGYDALFINDGDADRIGAGDRQGNFVNPHRIIALITQHMVDRGASGRVVSTITASALLDRLCRKLGLELVSTPVGFKWIYGEMERGGVMVGGEESGGIGLPEHVKERDGLLMALLLTEMMAQTGKDLGTLVAEMLDDLGHLEFARRGLTVTDEQMERFRSQTIPTFAPAEICGKQVVGEDRRDGVKFLLEGDAWVMMRPSGTEPLVRIYAEAETTEEVEALLDWAQGVVEQ
ncbi:phosphoglucosamine mutase [Adlercreutzia murintestinalis]|uniref:phosphoglucosamine mutase n=1 Tax=Adlercreutzia murintestinalis TaxID=2941325 RepID=UPI00203B265E|nr:phosphoglucosamine mutase [Adlercreutzia murintestinalis]